MVSHRLQAPLPGVGARLPVDAAAGRSRSSRSCTWCSSSSSRSARRSRTTPIYLLFGIVIWGFFVEAPRGASCRSSAGRTCCARSRFPRYVVVVSVGASALISFGLSMIVIAVVHGPRARARPAWTSCGCRCSSSSWSRSRSRSAFFLERALRALPRHELHLGGRPAGRLLRRRRSSTRSAWCPMRYAKLLLLNPMAQIIQDARYGLVTDRDGDDHAGLRHAVGAHHPGRHHARPVRRRRSSSSAAARRRFAEEA